jgi:hypothetical protein
MVIFTLINTNYLRVNNFLGEEYVAFFQIYNLLNSHVMYL